MTFCVAAMHANNHAHAHCCSTVSHMGMHTAHRHAEQLARAVSYVSYDLSAGTAGWARDMAYLCCV